MNERPANEKLDLDAIRERLASVRGRHYWRSLEELANTKAFQEFLHREFPSQASEWTDAFSRREFLQIMGASLALAGLSACTRQPEEKIVPYAANPPELVVSGKPLSFATAMEHCGSAVGLLVTSHEGRPTKIEGNPDHPASLGATDVFSQGSILTLYDPDRSQVVTQQGSISTWSAFLTAVSAELEKQRLQRGAGLRVLTETVISPTLAGQLRDLLTQFPAAKWHQFEPVTRDNVREGTRLAFGEYLNVLYRFDKAEVILAIDSDFLCDGPGSVRYAREFAHGRRVREGESKMNRLYAVESTPSNTGAKADHRLSLRPSQIEDFVRALAGELGVLKAGTTETRSEWLAAVVEDLKAHHGKAVVIAGEYQPPVVHALVHAINDALGNLGNTILFTDSLEANPTNQLESLRDLVNDMDSGRVELLLILSGNPVYNAPADFEFEKRLSKVKFRVHLGMYEDETSDLCHWHIPQAHFLESWSDTRAYDGTASMVQPLIAPLYQGKTAHEVLAVLQGKPGRSAYDLVRDYWKQKLTGNFESEWRRALHDGLIAATALPFKKVKLQSAIPPPLGGEGGVRGGLEVVFRPDPTIWDGRFANNGWLQELPKPLTKLMWDNAAWISPATAQRLGLSQQVGWRGGDVYADMVELEFQGRKMPVGVWIMPGQPDDCITLHLGNGRTRAGRVGNGRGFNAYTLRTSDALWFGAGVKLRKMGERFQFATSQLHHLMEAREPVKSATLNEFLKKPTFAKGEFEPHQTPSLYPGHINPAYAWGMTIDLTACVGCSACVIACQAENNIPVVGKTQCARHREMHWIRVDTYHSGDAKDPETYFQPVPCMHCENAPCEVVCPVGATVHSSEGLNEMVYNRCVGTRYCSNNCPYKVRRFNFLQYSDYTTPSLKLGRNPNVTVRSRGVMEKCTYCIQRISTARIAAELENRTIRDGEIVTACQAACPADAIVFGDINDPNSRVSKLKAEPLNYGLLAELNTRPRTTYLAHLRNPNPSLETEKATE